MNPNPPPAGLSGKIAESIRGIPKSGIREFFELVIGVPDVISLGVGEPDFCTPWHIREAAIKSLEQGRTSYTSNLGLLDLRQSIAKYVEKQFHVQYEAKSEILVTVGVSEALDIALRCDGFDGLVFTGCDVCALPSFEIQARGGQGLGDIAIAAHRARQQATRKLALVVVLVGEPAFERVCIGAPQIQNFHA